MLSKIPQAAPCLQSLAKRSDELRFPLFSTIGQVLTLILPCASCKHRLDLSNEQP